MAKRAAREAAEKPAQPQPQRRAAVKKTVKIGRPGYRVTKQFDPVQDQRSLLFQVSSHSTSYVNSLPFTALDCEGKDCVFPSFLPILCRVIAKAKFTKTFGLYEGAVPTNHKMQAILLMPAHGGAV